MRTWRSRPGSCTARWSQYALSADDEEAGTLVPDLATDTGTSSEGGKIWTFTLKDGTKFEDGTPITCADVKYGVSRTFATDIITDGPTYAISLLDIPKDDDGNSQYKGPYNGERPGPVRQGRDLLRGRQDDHLQPGAPGGGLQLHDHADRVLPGPEGRGHR